MSLKGNLETFFLAGVFQLLANEGKTGILTVMNETDQVRVFFKEGTIIYALGSQKEARLGFLLRSRGIISQEELEKCMEIARQDRKLLGKILVEKGYITLETFKKFIKKQIEEIIYNLFLWQTGSFEYKDAELNLDQSVITHLHTMEVILEASRRIDEMSTLRKQISSEKMVFKISEKYPEKKEIKLNANEWHVLSLIDSRRTVAEIISLSGYEEFPVYKLLFSLLSFGLVEKAEKMDSVKKSEGPGDYIGIITVNNDILHAVYRNLQSEVGTRAAKLFDGSKSRLSAKQRILFRDFDPEATPEASLEVLKESMLSYKNVANGPGPGEFLVDAFCAYLGHILENALGVIGVPLTRKILGEIEKIVSYVDKYHEDSRQKDAIIAEVRRVLVLVEGKVEEQQKQKPAGLFGRFKKS